jgi:hypothetical protein
VTDGWRQSPGDATDQDLRGDDPDTPYNVYAIDGRVSD